MAQAFLFIEKVLGNHGYMHHGKKMIFKKKKSLWNGFINRGATKKVLSKYSLSPIA